MRDPVLSRSMLVICAVICFVQIHVVINSNVCCCRCVVMLNVRRHLQQKVGVPEKTRNEVISLIFGKEGLTNSKGLVDFELGYFIL